MRKATIAERITRRAEIQGHRLLFTHDALLSIEEATGIDIWNGDLDLIKPSAAVLRSILAAAIGEPSPKAAGSLIRPSLMAKVRLAILDGWEASMPEPDPEASGSGRKLTWMSAWAMARLDLGLSDDEWLAMTPRMVQELNRRRLEQMRHQERMAGKIGAAVATFGYRAPKTTLTCEDFMDHPSPVTEQAKMNSQTGEDVLVAFSPFMDTESKKVTDAILKAKN